MISPYTFPITITAPSAENCIAVGRSTILEDVVSSCFNEISHILIVLSVLIVAYIGQYG